MVSKLGIKIKRRFTAKTELKDGLKMKYGYCRVSTAGQATTGNSLQAQKDELHKEGAEIIFSDTFTGKQLDRPELDKLLSILQPGDVLLVTKLDRIARTAAQGSELIQGLLKRGIKVHILNMGRLDDTPTGRLICNVLLAFAEFERDMIIERTQEGKAIAKQHPDFHEGRPKKYSKAQMQHALSLLGDHSFSQVEQLTGISMSTLKRAAREQKQASM